MGEGIDVQLWLDTEDKHLTWIRVTLESAGRECLFSLLTKPHACIKKRNWSLIWGLRNSKTCSSRSFRVKGWRCTQTRKWHPSYWEVWREAFFKPGWTLYVSAAAASHPNTTLAYSDFLLFILSAAKHSQWLVDWLCDTEKWHVESSFYGNYFHGSGVPLELLKDESKDNLWKLNENGNPQKELIKFWMLLCEPVIASCAC